MKSGPTLNGAVRCPARRSAPIKPVATVVFPLPDAGAAMTTAGVLTTGRPVGRGSLRSPLAGPSVVVHCAHHWQARRSWFTAFTTGRPVGRGSLRSPLDALLALSAHVHRVLDLRHVGDQVRNVEQLLGRVAAGDDDVLRAWPRRQHLDYLRDVDPPPLQRIGELVEHVEIVPLR